MICLMAWPIGNLDDFRESLDTALESQPFSAVILYAAGDGADEQVRAYVSSHRDDSAAITGEQCRAYTLGNGDEQALMPEDVASIAEYMGADRAAVPGIVFFTEPAMQPEGLSLQLASLLSDPDSVFGEIAAMVTASASAAPHDRLPDLRQRLTDAWSPQVVGGGLVEGGSVSMALTHILGQLRETTP